MTDHSASAVTHDDGLQNGRFIAFLGHHHSAVLGKAVAGLLGLVLFAVWAWSLVLTWISLPQYAPPLFQTSVCVAVVAGVAFYGYKTLAWVFPLIASVLWIVVSITPFEPIWMCAFQAATVAFLLFATVFAVTAIDQSEKPRF